MRVASVGPWFIAGLVAAGAISACSDDSEKAAEGCAEGSETCACYPNATCDGELQCLSNRCVDTRGSAGKGGVANGPSTGGAPVDAEGGEQNAGGSAQGGRSGSGGRKPTGTGGTTPNGPTPVSLHGALAVSGTNLVDESGAPVKLEGISSMWLNWDATGYAENADGLAWMRDNWNLEVFRVAMGVDAEGAYLEDPSAAKNKVNRIVQNAIDLGVYVIIDWHDHEALSHQAEAVAFFREMSETWGDYPNVLYEVFNEPLAVDWATELAPYHRTLVSAIRENDPDNLILLGTPNWDQDVDVAALNPLSGSNLLYTLHFYACTHGAEYRNKAKSARALGLPLFVTEWGATHADGGVDGIVCETEARAWHDWLDQTNISWTAWKLDGCEPPSSCDSSCMFRDRSISPSGPFDADSLNGHAPIVIDEMKMDLPATGGSGGASGGTGGRHSTGGTGAGGTANGGGGTGGSPPIDPFPPDPAGCVLISSCTDCCQTVGAYALDALSNDATAALVTAFGVSTTSASASFSFTGAGQVGGIFFKLAGPETIGSIGVDIAGSGGALEVALVRANGADGCTYAVIGNSLSSIPDCWGLGAGPYAGLDVDQIEVRLRADFSGNATLLVADISYGP
jgi:endoglucanase